MLTPKEFDDCPSSPDGKHSNSWYANFDCQHCNSGGQESTFARLYDDFITLISMEPYEALATLRAIAVVIGYSGEDYSGLPEAVQKFVSDEYENGRAEGYDEGYSDAEEIFNDGMQRRIYNDRQS